MNVVANANFDDFSIGEHVLAHSEPYAIFFVCVCLQAASCIDATACIVFQMNVVANANFDDFFIG